MLEAGIQGFARTKITGSPIESFGDDEQKKSITLQLPIIPSMGLLAVA
jgi:hypothetical protein